MEVGSDVCRQSVYAEVTHRVIAELEEGQLPWVHPTRLARDQSGTFGSDKYAREEMVAEIASSFTCSSLSIQPTVRHADYIGSWLAVLREDDRGIFRAASAASKAANFLLEVTLSNRDAEE